MSIGIDELFEMLSWDSDEKTQRKGIEEGKKVKNISIFIQPVEGKKYWENCAKIIEQKSDAELEIYLDYLLEWLQDQMWPGFYIIHRRLKNMPAKLISSSLAYTIKKASISSRRNEMWLIYLASLSKDKEVYECLGKQEKHIIRKYIKKRKYNQYIYEYYPNPYSTES